jgi:hypothetical protein
MTSIRSKLKTIPSTKTVESKRSGAGEAAYDESNESNSKLGFINKEYKDMTNDEKKLYLRYNIIPPMITCPECLNRKLQEQIYEFQFILREHGSGNIPQELTYGDMMTLVGLHDECCRRRVMGMPDVPIGYAITNINRYDEKLDPLYSINTIKSNFKVKESTESKSVKVKVNPVIKGGRKIKIKSNPLSVIITNQFSSIYSEYDQSKMGEYVHTTEVSEDTEIPVYADDNVYIKQINSHLISKDVIGVSDGNASSTEDVEIDDLLKIAESL